jgi:hypothetical protein
MKVQAEQEVQWVIRGQQALSYEDSNIVGSRQSLVHLTSALVLFKDLLCFTLIVH